MINGEILVYPYYTDRITSPIIIGEILVHPYYTDRITSPMIIGEILVFSLYRQNYLADDHRRDFGSVYKKINITYANSYIT